MNLSFKPIALNSINNANNIAGINNLSNITSKFSPISFRGRAPVGDSFEKAPDIINVKIQTMEGKPIDAQIKRKELKAPESYIPQEYKPVQFEMDKGNDTFNYYAKAFGTKKAEKFLLDELYTDKTAERKYKGAGTELLKCIIKESKKRGLDGAVILAASNDPPPFEFYYKNNFKVTGNYSYQNAAIEYAIRNNIPVTKVMEGTFNSLPMEIDSKEAEAFLKGKRIHKDRNFETIEKRIINGDEYEANLIQAPEGLEEEYYIQIINSSKEERKQVFIASLREEEDTNGEKYLEAFNIRNAKMCPEDKDFAESMIQKSSEKLGYKKAVITSIRK